MPENDIFKNKLIDMGVSAKHIIELALDDIANKGSRFRMACLQACYRSTKHSGNGIGLTAIAATAEKYGGSAQASNSDTEFFIDVVLKI